MAKIALVTRHISATSWQLAKALRSQQHDVFFLTTYGETVENNSSIELLTYFKKWSFLEGLRIIPLLMAQQIQIVHVILEEDRMAPAQMVLASFARSHPAIVLTTSLLHIRYGFHRRNPVRYLVEESDIITCPTAESLGRLRGLNVRAPRQGRGVLPPVLNLHDSSLSVDEWFEHEDHRLQESLGKEKYFVMPFQEAHFNPHSSAFSRIRTLAQKHQLVLWGSYSHWPLRERKQFAQWMEQFDCAGRWHVTGEISPTQAKMLFQNSEAFVLAGQHFSPAEMTEYYLWAIQARANLILDSSQAGLHPTLWKNAVNCWILDTHHLQAQLIKLLNRHSLKVSETVSEDVSTDRHLIDHSLNELNRLYNRAMTLKKVAHG